MVAKIRMGSGIHWGRRAADASFPPAISPTGKVSRPLDLPGRALPLLCPWRI